MVKYNKLFEGVLDGKNNQKQIRKMLSDNGGFLERHPVRGYGEYVYGPTEEHPDSCKVVLKVRPEEGEEYTAETYILICKTLNTAMKPTKKCGTV